MSRREPERRRRPTSITIPERVSPHVKLVFAEMQRQGVTYDEAEEGSGVRRAAMKAWRRKNKPSLDSIEAVFGYLGWDFVPVPRADKLPPEVVKVLKPVAASLGMTMPQTVRALIEIVADIHVDVRSARPTKPKGVPVPTPAKRRRGDPHPDQPGFFGELPTLH